MKNGIWSIAKKELRRFFGDRRMMITTLLLPGLLIYVMYSFMGNALGNMFTVDEDQTIRVSAVNLPGSMKQLFSGTAIELEEIEDNQFQSVKEDVSEQQCAVLLCFPAQFDEQVAAYDNTGGSPAPNIEMYYNSTSAASSTACSLITEVLDVYESQLVNKFDINNNQAPIDLATEEDTAGSIFSMLMPMLLLLFLYSGCMAVATESIAGEKERGTIATMLVTPVRRSEIAIGKIFALSIIALLSGASSALGTILSLPKLMGSASESMTVNVYTVSDYLLLGLIILSTVLVLVAAISLISAFAKTIKEAQTLVMPLMIVVMALGITAMFGNGIKTELFYYLIPLYNSVQCMVGIFSFEIVPFYFAITVVSNLCYTALGALALAKMFNSEKIIFSK